jgi:hypothetical protein
MRVVVRSSWWSTVVACAFVVCLAFAAAGSAAVAMLPNPCTLLARVHPEHTFGHGATMAVTHKRLQKYGSGANASSYCSETVGKLLVALSLSGSAGGSGGVKVISQTHPSGLGSAATLTVGSGPTGSPVDFISFRKSSLYASLSANGANPSSITTLARQLYKLLP